MSQERQVLEKLIEDHKGRQNAITQEQLSDASGSTQVRSEASYGD